MGTRLNMAPVCFTLAQVRFNQVLAMEPHLPAIQDELRAAGFPDYSTVTAQLLEMSAGADGELAVRPKQMIRHFFRNRKNTAAILLDPGVLTYELSDYPVFDEFAATFASAMSIVSKHLPVEYSERLGMRMLDAVQPRPGESLSQYLIPHALGFGEVIALGLEHQQTLTESIFKANGNTVLVRAVRLPRGAAMPPDLAPLRIQLSERFTSYEGETIMLDCDSFREAREDFDVNALTAQLGELKSVLSKSFRALVTDFALETWR